MKELAFGFAAIAILGGVMSVNRAISLNQQNILLEARIENLQQQNERLTNQLLGSYGGR